MPAATAPLVSVIVPNYRHANYLAQRLDSILEQSTQDIELIVLDDASPDHSRDIINDYAQRFPDKITCIFNEHNSGSPFKQWQKGFEAVRGTYIWIAESDDFAHPLFLEKCLAAFAEQPEAGVVFTQSYAVDERGDILYSFKDKYLNKIFPENIWLRNFVRQGEEYIIYTSYSNTIPNAGAVLFKKSCLGSLDASAPFTAWKLMGDWLFWIQLLAHTQVVFIAEELNYFRQHTHTARTTALRNGDYVREFCDIQAYTERRFPAARHNRARARFFIVHFWKQTLLQAQLSQRQQWLLLRHIAAYDTKAVWRIVKSKVFSMVKNK